MLPLTTRANEHSLVNIRQYDSKVPHRGSQRCYFFLIHLVFYIIILIIIYMRLGQVNYKQEIILNAIKSNHNRVLHQDVHNHTQ